MRGGSRTAMSSQFNAIKDCDVSVSSNDDRKGFVIDAATDTYWEPAGADAAPAISVRPDMVAICAKAGLPSDTVPEVACVLVAVDTTRDAANAPSRLVLATGHDIASLKQSDSVEVPANFCGWIPLALTARRSSSSASMRLASDGWNLPQVGSAKPGPGSEDVSAAAVNSFSR